jgi:NAD(P)-dependent dehydrogenase (short-subunit alcohol dehydrogenase family)
MDLGIAGRKAIVCASSRGLGRACASRLAEAGCEVVINGLNRERLEAVAADMRKATGVKITAVAADVGTADGQKALFAACPEPDILVNNNAGPPFRDFRELDRQKILDGVVANMAVAIELTQKVIDPMVALTRRLRHRPPALQHRGQRQEARHAARPGRGGARRHHPGQALRPGRRVRLCLRVPVLGTRRLHHGTEPADRRRPVSGGVLTRRPARQPRLYGAAARRMMRRFSRFHPQYDIEERP